MSEGKSRQNFLTDIVDADLKSGANGGQVVTRFPPEPNGFLHIGHSKSIILNFGLAQQFGGRAHMRFDDTNPTTEETLYVENIQNDVKWLGFDWGKNLFYASDFFEQMFECAVRLVKDGKAYVDSQSQDAIREQRGNFDRPGVNSPHRERTVAQNLELLTRMRKGEFKDGECVLRARIDMAHPNVLMRDPLLYRIRHAHHHRTGDSWCIYPMYDYAHPLEDAFEGVTHSICTLEFETNRELYDWVLDNLGPWKVRPRQYEFARLALGFTVMSKRKLLQLVNEKRVSGWDDPRMPTIAGMRRRGVTSQALRDFSDLIGVAKNNSLVDIGKFEFAIRADLEKSSPRALAVLNPLPVTLTNYPADKSEELEVPWWPAEPARGGTRKVPFGRQLLVEREDFLESPPSDWKRLAPGREVRLIGGYIIKCEEVVKENGNVVGLRCSYDPGSLSGSADGRKVAGALNWVEATRAFASPVRLYDRLFQVELPDGEGDFLQHLNPHSLVTAEGARLEPALAKAEPGARYQFLRQGYFIADTVDSRPGAPVFLRTITLKDGWAKSADKAAEAPTPHKEPAKPAGPPKKARAELRAEARAADPVLRARFEQLRTRHALSAEEAEQLSLDPAQTAFFEAAVASGAPAKAVAKWLLNDLLGLVKDAPLEKLPFPATALGELVQLVEEQEITPSAGKQLLAHLVEKGGHPVDLVKSLGLGKAQGAAALEEAVAKVFQSQAAEVARYRSGEKKLFGVLVGAVMKETHGAADAAAVRKFLTERLEQA